MEKGFITISVVVIAVLVLLIVVGGGYTALKFNQLEKANTELTEKLSLMNEPEQIAVDEPFDTEVSTTSAELSLSDKSSTSTEVESDVKEEPKVTVEQKIVYVPIKTEDPATSVTPKHVDKVPGTETTSPVIVPEYLKISDVEVEVDAFVVNIYWKTNKKSDSRVVIDGDDIFVSDSHDSTDHHVKISSLEWSSNYAFEIIAEADGEKDTFFDNVATERKFNVVVTDADPEDKCIEVFVIDTKKLPLQNTLIRISGAWRSPSGARYMSDTLEQKTDNYGSVVYCGPITEMKVENVNTRDIYLNGTFVLN